MSAEAMQAVRDNFEAAKKIELEIIKTQVIVSERIDMLVDLRDKSYSFFKEFLTLGQLDALDRELTSMYEDMVKIVEGYKFEDFAKEDMADPFEHMVPTTKSLLNEKDLFERYVKFLCIRPFAERALKLNRLVLEEIEKAEADNGEAAKD